MILQRNLTWTDANVYTLIQLRFSHLLTWLIVIGSIPWSDLLVDLISPSIEIVFNVFACHKGNSLYNVLYIVLEQSPSIPTLVGNLQLWSLLHCTVTVPWLSTFEAVTYNDNSHFIWTLLAHVTTLLHKSGTPALQLNGPMKYNNYFHKVEAVDLF